MSSILLNQVMVGDKPMVRYLMKQKGGNVEGKTPPRSAMWMLTNDKAKVPYMTEEFPGFPVTADGVYFFDGNLNDGDGTSSGTETRGEGIGTSSDPGEAGATFPIGEGTVETEESAPGCGPDYCEIPELAEKPKKSRKKAKDVVCE